MLSAWQQLILYRFIVLWTKKKQINRIRKLCRNLCVCVCVRVRTKVLPGSVMSIED